MNNDNLLNYDLNNLVNIYSNDVELNNKIRKLEINKDSGNIGISKLSFVCEDISIKEKDDQTFYIQFLDNKYHNKQEGFSSYIYSDDYKEVILDLLNSLYNSGYVYIDAVDLMNITYNKSFNCYKYIINDVMTEEIIKNILNETNIKNKNYFLICHGNQKKADNENKLIQETLKTRNNELCLYSYITNNINENDRYILLFIEM